MRGGVAVGSRRGCARLGRAGLGRAGHRAAAAAGAGHDARCGLPIFSQQVALLNQRLGKASDPRQVEALFMATQQGGLVDFADFLRRESTRLYFEMSDVGMSV